MSLAKKVAFNTSVQLIGKVLNTIIGLFSVAIITRYLGVSGYGEYTTIFAYVMFFNVISDFGFFWIIVREIARGQKNAEKIIHNVGTIRLIFAALVTLAALVLVFFLPYPQTVRFAIILVAFSMLWMGQNGVYLALFQSKLRMDLPVIAEFVSRALGLGLVFLAAKFGYGLFWIVAAAVFGTFINYLINMIFSFRYVRFGYKFDRVFVRSIFLETLPLGVVTILGLIYFKIDTVILSLLKTSTDVGIYGAPYKILEILIAMPAMFVGSVFPALSEAFATQNQERVKVLLRKSFNILSMGSFGVIAGVFALAPNIIEFVAGPEYLSTSTIELFKHAISSDTVLQILIFAVGCSFWSSLFISSIITFGKQKELLKPYAFLMVFNVVANLILIPRYSYVAAASVTVVTEMIILIYSWIILKKIVPAHLEFLTPAKAFLAAILMSIVLYTMRNLNIFFLFGLGTFLYISLLYIFRAFSKETLLALFRRG